MKLVALSSMLAVSALYSASLTIYIDGIKTMFGHIRVKIARSESVYHDNSRVDYFKKVAVKNSSMSINFDSLPAGIYAVKLFHDRNNNEKMDRSSLGFPAEPYGFSNNIRPKTRAANFTEAKFSLSKNDTIHILVE